MAAAHRPVPAPQAPLRICHAPQGLPDPAPAAAGADALEARLTRIRQAGFDAVLIPAPWLLPAGAHSLAPVDADLSAIGSRT